MNRVRKGIKWETKLTRLRKDFSVWLKIQASKFSFQAWWEYVEGNGKASPRGALGKGWLWLLWRELLRPPLALLRDIRSGVIHTPFLCTVQPGKQRWEMQRAMRFLRAWETQLTLCFPRAWKCLYFMEELWFELAPLISMGFYHISWAYLDSSLDIFHLGLISLPLKQPLDSDRWPPTLEAQQKYESSLTLELRVNLLDWLHLPPGHCSCGCCRLKIFRGACSRSLLVCSVQRVPCYRSLLVCSVQGAPAVSQSVSVQRAPCSRSLLVCKCAVCRVGQLVGCSQNLFLLLWLEL